MKLTNKKIIVNSPFKIVTIKYTHILTVNATNEENKKKLKHEREVEYKKGNMN